MFANIIVRYNLPENKNTPVTKKADNDNVQRDLKNDQSDLKEMVR